MSGGFIQISDKLIWIEDVYGEWHLLNIDTIESILPEPDE